MYLFERLCLFQEGNIKNIKKHSTGVFMCYTITIWMHPMRKYRNSAGVGKECMDLVN